MLLTCPRISPEWQLAATLALAKPKPYTKDKIRHTSSRQRWPRNARKIFDDFAARHQLIVDLPTTGAHRFRAELDPANATRLSRRLSRLLPTLWFILDCQLLRDGVFYTRTGRYKLELVRASRVRLRRSVRYGFLGDIDHAITRAHHRAGKDATAK
jgi:hypothetical protein